ncbi:MAG: hypothetical protein ACOC9N_00320 [Gemmatimonadota bacterium]
MDEQRDPDESRHTPVPDAHDELAAELEAAFAAWGTDPRSWSDEAFESRALEAFRLQFEANRPYARYCRATGATPESVESWRDVPPVPTTAFRAVELIVGDPADARLRFRTSGTTGGAAARGTHLVRRPATYRASLLGPFRHAVLDGRPAGRILSLHPSFEPARDSSLAWMFDTVLDELGGAGSARVEPSDAGKGAVAASVKTLERAAGDGEPMAILGTTLALADWGERLAAASVRLELPTGSRLMDTGGAKGREGLDRDAAIGGLLERFGLPEEAAVNEFGMTELLSQRYGRGLGRLALRGPPWLRTRVLDPVTLDELPEGDEGILCHYDLANVGSMIAVLTADRGRAVGDAVEWLGRTPGATPRGCSLATAELLEAQR